jgi:hypothetical protein
VRSSGVESRRLGGAIDLQKGVGRRGTGGNFIGAGEASNWQEVKGGREIRRALSPARISDGGGRSCRWPDLWGPRVSE